MKLFEFLDARVSNPSMWPRNQYVDHPGWASLYVRVTKRIINHQVVDPVIDLANIAAEKPGNGAFRKLVSDLRERYPQATLFVESVLGERFKDGLLRMGFTQKPHEPSFYLLPE
jgi:hypothetical protein